MSRPEFEGEDDLAGLIDSLEREQERLIFDRFDHQHAWELGNVLVELATAGDLAVTIDVRTHGQVLFHCARPGTTPDNDRWVQRKSRTVFHFLESSWLVRNRFLARAADFARVLGGET